MASIATGEASFLVDLVVVIRRRIEALMRRGGGIEKGIDVILKDLRRERDN